MNNSILFIILVLSLSALPPTAAHAGQMRTLDSSNVASRIKYLETRLNNLETGLRSLAKEEAGSYDAQISQYQSELAVYLSNNAQIRLELDRAVLKNQLSQLAIAINRFEASIYAKFFSKRIEAAHVTRAVNRTDKALLRATKFMRKQGESEEASPDIRRASDLQEEAREKLAAKNLLEAWNLTLKAREIIAKTVKSALEEGDTDDLLERETQVWEFNNKRIEQLEQENPSQGKLEKARQLQETAMNHLNEKNLFAARQCIQAVRRLIERLPNAGQGNGDAASIVRRAEAKLERVRKLADAGNEDINKVLALGSSHIEKAQSLLSEGRSKAAEAQALVALKLIEKAADMAENSEHPEKE